MSSLERVAREILEANIDDILKKPEEIEVKVELSKIATVDATGIALNMLGPRAIPITNTTMLGAIVGATNWIKLESLFEPIRNEFKGEIGEKNIEVVRKGFDMVDVKVMEVK